MVYLNYDYTLKSPLHLVATTPF